MQRYEEIGAERTWVNRAQAAVGFGPLEEEEGDVPRKYRRISLYITCAYVCLAPLMAIYAPKLQSATSIDFTPPSGHQSAHAQDAMNKYWPATEKSSIIVSLIYSTGDATIPHSPINATTGKPNNVAGFVYAMLDKVNTSPYKEQLSINGSAYYTLPGALPNPLNDRLLSEDSKSMVIALNINNPGSTGDGSPYATLVDDLRDWTNDLKAEFFPHHEFDSEVTGQKVLTIDARKGTIQDAAKADMIVIPVAFIILAFFLGSFRLMLLPLVTIGVCVGTAFALCYPIAKSLSVQSTTPQLMMSATLALNIDYNLFLLMRFQENLKLGHSLYENIRLLVTHTAIETVLGSGSLVSIAFFSMAIIPCSVLITTGLCCGLTIAIVVIVNITLTPSLLTIFSGFFTGTCLTCSGSQAGDRSSNAFTQVKEKITSFSWLNNRNDEMQMINEYKSEEEVNQASWWFKIGTTIQRAPLVVIVVVMGLFAFLYIHFGDLQTSLDPLSFVPRNADSVSAWRRMSKSFPPGEFEQYYLVFSDIEQTADLYDMSYNVIHDVVYNTSISNYLKGDSPYTYVIGPTVIPVSFTIDQMMKYLGATNVTEPPFACCNGMDCSGCSAPANSVTVFNNVLYDLEYCLEIPEQSERPPARCPAAEGLGMLPFAFQAVMLKYAEALPMPPSLDDINLLTMASVYSNEVRPNAMYYRVLLPFDPSGKEAKTWMDEMGTLMGAQQEKYRKVFPKLELNLAGGNTIAYDFGKIVDDHMFTMLAVLVGAVTCVVVLIFRSLVIPPIMAVTILYSVGCAFGMGYFFFQTTSFSWFYSYLDGDFKDEGVSWSVPPMVISITVALAIDYNIFMLTRISEYKRMGMSTAQSILSGMRAVGTTICGAGIIMSVAFGGLMFSHVVSLNQFSVILVTSVLLDTFLLSTIFVPACGFLLGDKFWWPSAEYYRCDGYESLATDTA
eukprot:TRINITY_DN65315_c0_g1_i1.p1 TRINITY_DN65315_c0_g1~~TRINITY_DN65315_c0_g1_i1.p1  ORF type:complete len:952 (+),score=413.58 TRINITY_DN65315_c0_g1_i1:55-2910(+)